jgi:hypothetical protein
MSNVNHVNTVHVGTNAAVAAAGTKLQALAKGQMALVDSATMTALDVAGAQALSSRATVYIAVGEGGGTFKLSSAIKGNLVNSYAGQSYVAPVQKNMEVGKNAAGAFLLPAEDETEYQLNILINDDQRPHGQKQTRDQYNYTTKVSATSGEVAFAIASLFGQKFANGNFKQYGSRWVTLGIVSDVTAGAVGVGEDMTFTFGSKVVSVATTPTVAAGDYLEVTANDSNGTSKAYHYLIVDVDTTNDLVYLDTPFGLPSATVVVANLGTYNQATADAAEYAFDIIALVPTDDWNGIDEYEVVDFDASYFASANIGLDGEEADTNIVADTNPGTGTGYQVFDLVYHAQGYEGVNSRTRWFDHHINPDNEAVVGSAYDMLTIGFDAEFRSDFQDTQKAPKAATLALLDGEAQSSGFVAILDGFFSDVLGFTAITSL